MSCFKLFPTQYLCRRLYFFIIYYKDLNPLGNMAHQITFDNSDIENTNSLNQSCMIVKLYSLLHFQCVKWKLHYVSFTSGRRASSSMNCLLHLNHIVIAVSCILGGMLSPSVSWTLHSAAVTGGHTKLNRLVRRINT